MIKTTEALLLARTKLKMRKIRLFVTVVISSLVFTCLVFLSMASDGAIHSLKEFGKEGYGSRYLVQATPVNDVINPSDQNLINELLPINRDLISQKKAAAKKLNLTYDSATDNSLPLSSPPAGNGVPSATFINSMSKEVVAKQDVKNNAILGADYQSFISTTKALGAVKTYRGINQDYSTNGGSTGLKVLVNNKETFTNTTQQQFSSGPPTGVDTITSMGWRADDKGLLEPFVLPGQNLDRGADTSVPIIAPFSAAEQILGLKALPQTATSQQKLDRLVQVRTAIAGKTVGLCYRNSSSLALVDQTVQQQQEIEANKKKQDYTPPSLQHKLPDAACGPVTVKSDKRTAEEKKQDDNQKSFDKQFNGYEEPYQGIVTLRIVGLSPDLDGGASINAGSILSSLFSSSLGNGWVSPGAAVAQDPVATKAMGGVIETAVRSRAVYYAEFNSLKSMQRFIDQQTCGANVQGAGPITGGPAVYYPGNDAGATQKCIKQGKVFSVMPYGNSAGAIEQFRKTIWTVARVVVLVVVVIAALIMMGNIGKIIADSRRETAVFRALGAKRLDVTQIYFTYTLLVSGLVSLSSLLLGALVANAISNHFTTDLSASAVLIYNARDVHKQFVLFGVNFRQLIGIVGLIVVAGLISCVVPLLTNVRRNPIRDMRDE